MELPSALSLLPYICMYTYIYTAWGVWNALFSATNFSYVPYIYIYLQVRERERGTRKSTNFILSLYILRLAAFSSINSRRRCSVTRLYFVAVTISIIATREMACLHCRIAVFFFFSPYKNNTDECITRIERSSAGFSYTATITLRLIAICERGELNSREYIKLGAGELPESFLSDERLRVIEGRRERAIHLLS